MDPRKLHVCHGDIWRYHQSLFFPNGNVMMQLSEDRYLPTKQYSHFILTDSDDIYYHPWYQGSWGQHGAHLGPTGPKWDPCWSRELCYLWCITEPSHTGTEICTQVGTTPGNKESNDFMRGKTLIRGGCLLIGIVVTQLNHKASSCDTFPTRLKIHCNQYHHHVISITQLAFPN